jgi:hypothetical protein
LYLDKRGHVIRQQGRLGLCLLEYEPTYEDGVRSGKLLSRSNEREDRAEGTHPCLR